MMMYAMRRRSRSAAGTRGRFRLSRRIACALALSTGLAAGAAPTTGPVLADLLDVLRTVPAEASTDNSALMRAGQALKLAAALDLRKASRAINEALQADARNPHLHFFNSFIYHLQARQGDAEKTDLAIEGYQQAVLLEPSHWVAHEFLGLALMEKKQYARAQAAFAEALLLRPDDPVLQARMLAASYLAGDARTACGMADQLAAGRDASAPGFLRTAVSVYAACGEFAKAEQQRLAFERTGPPAGELQQLSRRLAQWQAFFRDRGRAMAAPDGAGMVKTQYGQQPGGGAAGGSFSAVSEATAGAAADAAAAAAKPGGPRMILVDVVMVRTEDSISTTKGVNLMTALTLQFGSSSTPAFSRSYSGNSGSEGTTVLTRAISVPALAYSLNLANANSNLNEVLARPTLAAVEGMRSEFFSGTNLNASVVSSGGLGGAGSAVSLEKRYGVRLTVLPQMLPNGLVKMAIDASRTFLKPPSANIGYTYKLELSEIQANANVVMRMGDTLVLGGLSEKESTSSRDGVPGLQDLPGFQYLFSQKSDTDYQKSVLILITPRPAAYTWLSDESRAAAGGGSGTSTSAALLYARHGDWFKPYPNLASVFNHLNQSDLYREFRTSDVTQERWDRMESTRERLRQALSFLYY
jgi:tetratricopeptide (TPR) repeat protein